MVPPTDLTPERLRSLARRGARAIWVWLSLMGRAAWKGFVEFYNSDDLTYAASIAYYALLSLFPALLLAFSVLGGFAVEESHRQAIIDFFLRYFPTHLDFLTKQLDAFRQTRVPIGVGGGVALAWAALGVFGAISSAVNHAWRVEKPRSYLGHKLVSFLMMLAAGLLLALALALMSLMSVLRATWAADLVLRFPSLVIFQTLLVRWATTGLLIVVFGFIFYYVPNTRVRFRDVWPGAILTGLVWRATLAGFSYYVRDPSRYNLVHGSIAAFIIFLVWVYTSAVVLMYGVEFTAAYARLCRVGRPGGSCPP